MSLLRQEFDVRPLFKGIHLEPRHVVSNQIGRHVYHVGEIIDIRCDKVNVEVKIKGRSNEHFVGEVVAFSSDAQHSGRLQLGQMITFDEDNIFNCHEASA